MKRALRILLVEDDPEDALLFRHRCPPDFIVEQVADRESALLRLRQGGIDLCFTDFRLGADSGLGLVQSARREGLRTPLVMITGDDQEALGENALLAGATDFLAKAELHPATLRRAARWALIRRHVESRRDEQSAQDLLDQLLSEEEIPPPALVASATETLRQVVYASQARRAGSAPELLRLCADFSARNARIGVTGLLVQAGNCFLQVLEGEDAAVTLLLERIRRDARHSEMAIILDQAVRGRAFPQWSMGCLHLHRRYEISRGNWMNVLSGCNQLLQGGRVTRDRLALLIRGLPELLARQSSQLLYDPG